MNAPVFAHRADFGLDFGRMALAVAASRGDPRRGAAWATRRFGGNSPVTRALAAGDAAAGGFMVDAKLIAEVIELLRPLSVVRRMGAYNPPLVGGNIAWPKVTSGIAADYIGENQNAPHTAATFGQLKLSARKIAALVPISNDLIRGSHGNADMAVRDELVGAIAKREDAAFIRDPGLGNSPKGLRYLAATSNVFAANGSVSLANVTVDLGKLVLALKNANVRMLSPGWLMAPRTEQYLMMVRDTNGAFAFRAEMIAGKLWGYPFAATTQIPTDLGAGNESEIYFADFADVVIADVPNMKIEASSTAAYFDGSTLKPAFSLDQTVIRAVAEHDMGLRHDVSVAVLTAVTWGAS